MWSRLCKPNSKHLPIFMTTEITFIPSFNNYTNTISFDIKTVGDNPVPADYDHNLLFLNCEELNFSTLLHFVEDYDLFAVMMNPEDLAARQKLNSEIGVIGLSSDMFDSLLELETPPKHKFITELEDHIVDTLNKCRKKSGVYYYTNEKFHSYKLKTKVTVSFNRMDVMRIYRESIDDSWFGRFESSKGGQVDG